MDKPIVYDFFCGLGGWSEGFIAEGYECIGYDIEEHAYWVPDNPEADGSKHTKPIEKRGWTQGCAVSLGLEGAAARPCTKLMRYPGELILRDVRSIHGSECKDAAVLVASPPCQAYSYRSMPWKKAKALPPPDNTLFNECFRIQREAIEAAGHYIPLVVENVRGAQKWVGRARANYGSFFMWGDVGMVGRRVVAIVNGAPAFGRGVHAMPREVMKQGVAHRSDGMKGMGLGSASWRSKDERSSNDPRNFYSKSPKRKMASALNAKIPLPLSSYIARAFLPHP